MPNFVLVVISFTVFAQLAEPRATAQTHRLCDAFRGIPSFRQSVLKPADRQTIVVNDSTYQVLGLLGESTSRVYLAKASNAKRVAIKVLKLPTTEDGFEKSFVHEVLVTLYLENARIEYYRRAGHATPKVIDMKLHSDEFIVVKNYAEGVTYRELKDERLVEMPASMQFDLLELANIEIDQLKKLVTHPTRGFWPWLQKHRDVFEERYPAMAEIRKRIDAYSSATISEKFTIDTADFEARPGNLLLRKSGQWLLFDP